MISTDPFSSIPDALEAFARGEVLVVVDDEKRENEGDLVFAADFVTPEKINFMIACGRGLVCTPLTRSQAQKLDLPLMVEKLEDSHATAFTVSIDAKVGTSTGISAHDRFLTTQLLTSPEAKAADFVRPGHIFPLIAKDAGVLERPGHTEAAVDLCKLSKLNPIAVICEVLNEDGTCARLPELINFAREHGLKLITIEDLIAYRKSL